MPTIIRASHMGFCFGVRDALKVAAELNQPAETAVYGELVHNAEVNAWLTQQQYETIQETERDTLPGREHIMITAHGISETRRRQLIDGGKKLIDTTCPLVRRVHDTAMKLAEQDYFVILVGNRHHVETQGITEDLPAGQWQVVGKPEDVVTVDQHRIGIICQTTMPAEVAEACRDKVIEQNPGSSVRWINTICRPTKQRQTAIETLCEQTELVIVVGGINSNNTRRLAQRCRVLGTVAHHVESHRDLQAAWFEGIDKIGITAGTSTPDATIDAVEKRVEEITARSSAGATPAQKTPSLQMDRRRWGNAQWVSYFRDNLADTPEIAWSQSPTLTPAELRAVSDSVKTFQLGESGEGKHLLGCARSWIDSGGDPDYLKAATLFLNEEHRHSALLARFLYQEKQTLLRKQWSDGCFRFLRHLAGLRTSIAVLVTAEIMAQVYYLALYRATESPTLRGICKRVMRDERSHVQFQQQQKDELSKHWSPLRRRVVMMMERLLFEIACRVVWHDHRRVFVSAKMSWSDFRNRSLRRWHAANRISP